MELIRYLTPAPQRAKLLGEHWSPPAEVRIEASPLAADDPGLERLRARLGGAGCELRRVAGGEADIRLERTGALGDQAYQLLLSGTGVVLRASHGAGFYYGLCTLDQWLALHEEADGSLEVCGVEIEDAPDFAQRGVMLDVARSRHPRMATLYELVDRLSSWKYNRLQLYMEADFAFTGCEEAWTGRNPYRAEELRALDAYCRARHVELVPNQQSFGHLHHWLKHDRWRHLAEVPGGVEHPFHREPEPFSLDPTNPESLAFLRGLYDELLPCFTSGEFNVGLDETFDLGEGHSKAICAERGKHRVYVEFLRKVHELVTARGKRMQFWGDIVLQRPETIRELPEDAVAMVWGYAADHPFERELATMAESGLTFDVCPGTSSWNSFGGRLENAMANLRNAAIHGARFGARGLLVTDWGDRGHLQPLPVSYPGWLAGAAFSWNTSSAKELENHELPGLLDRWAFEDRSRALGRAVTELGRVQSVTGDGCVNGTAQFFLTVFGDSPMPHPQLVGVTEEGLVRGNEFLGGVLRGVERTSSSRLDARAIGAELQLARDLLLFGGALGRARLAGGQWIELEGLDRGVKRALREELQRMVSRHRELWLREFREGGLEESAGWLEFLVEKLK